MQQQPSRSSASMCWLTGAVTTRTPLDLPGLDAAVRHRTLDFVLSNTCNRIKTLLVSFVEIAFVSIVSRSLWRLTA